MSSRAEARRAKRDTLGWDRALVACYDSTGMRDAIAGKPWLPPLPAVD